MLPFLKPKRMDAGISMEYRKPDEGKEPAQEDNGLESAAKDLKKGLDTGDSKMVVEALKSFFMIVDAMPHEEGPHEE